MKQKNKHVILGMIVLVCLVLTTACTASQTDAISTPNPGETAQKTTQTPFTTIDEQQEVFMTGQGIQSELAREKQDDFPAETISRLAQANNQFAFDFYTRIKESKPDKNLVISPYSINVALAMVAGGASGQTLTEMQQVTHTQGFGEMVHPAWNALSREIESRAGASDPQEQGFDLKINNAVWAQAGYTFESAYLDLLAKNYGTGLRLADFKTNSEESRVAINDWVAEQTQQRIIDLLPQGAIHPLTRMALINTVYFKAPWRFPFNPENTTQEWFTLRSAETVEVPMMHQTQDLSYLQTEALSMVVLPYSAGKLEMIFIQPNVDDFESFEQSLSTETLKSLRDQQAWGGVKLSLPRYQFSTDVNLREALSALGMPTAFDPNQADFSGITRQEQIYIDAALHKAFIDVNEEGTEAAGATAILLAGKSMPARDPVEINFDSPFFFIVQDRETGSILFCGRVMNPLEN